MSTVSGIPASALYGFPLTAAASNGSGKIDYALLAQEIQLSAITTLTSSGNTASPLTYSATGLFGTQPQTAPASNTPVSATQAAQDAYLQTQYAVNQTLASLLTDSSTSNTANQDIFSQLYPAAAGINGPTGTASSDLLSLLNGGNSGTQNAQYAYLNAQYALNQALASLTANPASNVSSVA
jgi:hypothetical protein